MGGGLTISENAVLTDLGGLFGLTSIGGDLQVTGNASLTEEEVASFIDAVGEENIAGSIYAGENAE